MKRKYTAWTPNEEEILKTHTAKEAAKLLKGRTAWACSKKKANLAKANKDTKVSKPKRTIDKYMPSNKNLIQINVNGIELTVEPGTKVTMINGKLSIQPHS